MERYGDMEIELDKGKPIERGPNREIERDRWRYKWGWGERGIEIDKGV